MVAKMAERSADDADPGPDETTDDRPGEAELSADVIAARCAADAHAEHIGAEIDAQIEVVLANCRIALDALAAQHAYLADHSDLELDGGTRWAARWQLAAAAIAYAHALVDLSARGYVDAALPVSRTLHEALGVLGVINDDAEQTILTRWLEDREVVPKKVQAAAERQAKRALEDAPAQGVDLGGVGVKQPMEQIYSLLSDVSHIRRSGVVGMVRKQLRQAVYGPHPDSMQRAAGVASTVLSIEATIIGVGEALSAFYGGPYYRQVIMPIQHGLMQSAAQLMAITDI
jgi:hypothetical protein